MKKTYINIHHSAIFAKNDKVKQFKGINEGHHKRWPKMEKSELGYYGGYHYLIERDGEIRQYRKEHEVGAHNKTPDNMNAKAIGICFAGNMSKQELTPQQIESAVKLIKDIQKRLGIPDQNIKPHRDYKATQCPGNNIPDDVWSYLKDMSQVRDEPLWFTEKTRPWAEALLDDVDGFLEDPSPYRILEVLRKIEKDITDYLKIR